MLRIAAFLVLLSVSLKSFAGTNMKLMCRINDTVNWGTSEVHIEIEDKNQNNPADQRDVTVSFLPGVVMYQESFLQTVYATDEENQEMARVEPVIRQLLFNRGLVTQQVKALTSLNNTHFSTHFVALEGLSLQMTPVQEWKFIMGLNLDLQKKTASITVNSVIANYGISSGGECKFL